MQSEIHKKVAAPGVPVIELGYVGAIPEYLKMVCLMRTKKVVPRKKIFRPSVIIYWRMKDLF